MANAMPLSVYTTPEVFEQNITVNWTAVENCLGYFLEYRTSDDGVSWGIWKQLAELSKSSVSHDYFPNLKRGEYIEYKVCAKFISGNSPFTYSNIARKNSLPQAPKNLQINKTNFSLGENVVLHWDESFDVDDSVNAYEIQISKNNNMWEFLKKVYTNTFSYTPSVLDNECVKFRVCAVDDLSAKSEFSESVLLWRNDATTVKVCQNGIYKNAKIMVCKNGKYQNAKVLVCKNKTYEMSDF